MSARVAKAKTFLFVLYDSPLFTSSCNQPTANIFYMYIFCKYAMFMMKPNVTKYNKNSDFLKFESNSNFGLFEVIK